MSDMTDAAFLRRKGLIHWTGKTLARFYAIADSLDGAQWRKEPPDTVGDWVRKRNGVNLLIGVPENVLMVKTDRIHQPCDLWLKLPKPEVRVELTGKVTK